MFMDALHLLHSVILSALLLAVHYNTASLSMLYPHLWLTSDAVLDE